MRNKFEEGSYKYDCFSFITWRQIPQPYEQLRDL